MSFLTHAVSTNIAQCNFGKLNYFLGARAAKEGRNAPYGDVDFCKVSNYCFSQTCERCVPSNLSVPLLRIIFQNPEAICSSQKHKELKWIAGMFYWMESLQSYNVRGWNYMKRLHEFVDGGLQDPSFINAVSGIVNRGCHDPPCGTGEVDGLIERSGYFDSALRVLGAIPS